MFLPVTFFACRNILGFSLLHISQEFREPLLQSLKAGQQLFSVLTKQKLWLNHFGEQEGKGEAAPHHGPLLGGARHGHAAAGVHSLLGELDVHVSVVLGHQAVVQVIIPDLQEDGIPVHAVPTLEEIHSLGGDEHTVAVDVLHSNETATEEKMLSA